LSGAEWEAALAVRIAVFVHEQGGPADEEPDRYDPQCRHFLVETEGRIVGVARLYPFSPEDGIAKIGRIALLPEVRSRGWGRVLLRYMMDRAWDAGYRVAILDAQTYLLAFYEAEGFVAEGEVFLDGGIPHRRMRRDLRAATSSEGPIRPKRPTVQPREA
jgi:predicted GNAT family N-acyltransferase